MKITDFDYKLDSFLLSKGFNYYRERKIENLTFNKNTNTFLSTVKGSNIYKTSVEIKDDQIVNYSCDCPVNGICKHVVALMYEIKNDPELLDLPYQYAKKNNDFNFDSIKSFYASKEVFKDFLKEVELVIKKSNDIDKTVEEISEYFKFFQNRNENLLNYHLNVKELFESLNGLLSKDNLEILIDTYFSSLKYETKMDSYYFKKIYEKLEQEIRELYIRSIIKFKYFYLFELLDFDSIFINLITDYSRKINNYLFPFIFDNLKYQIDFLNYFKRNQTQNEVFLASYNFYNTPNYRFFNILQEILNKESLENIIEIVKKKSPKYLDEAIFYKDKFNFNINYYSLKLEEKDLVNNLEYLVNKDRRNLIEYLKHAIFNNNRKLITKNEALNILKMIDLDLIKLAKESPELLFSLSSEKELSDNIIVLKNEGLPLKLKEEYNFSLIEDKNRLDNFSLIIVLNKEKFLNNIYLKINKEQKIYNLDYDYKNIVLSKEILKDYYIVSKYLMSYISFENETKYNNVEKELLESRISNEKEVAESINLEKIDNLTTFFKEKEILLSEKILIKPIVDLEIESIVNRKIFLYKNVSLGIKIGNGREYVLKNVLEFLENIEAENYFSYGKNLGFYHNKNNFRKESMELLNILEKNKGEAYIKNNKGVFINSNLIEDILNIYMGSDIYLLNNRKIVFDNNYLQYHILNSFVLVEIEYKESSFKTNIDSMVKDSYVLSFKNFDYLVNTKNKNIVKLKHKSYKQRKLFHFILENKNISDTSTNDKIEKEIIPYVLDDIRVEENLKEKIIRDRLKIDSYFDYSEKKDEISLKYELFLNDSKISEIKDDYNKTFFNMYNELLINYGFIEGKIKEQDKIIHFLKANLENLNEFGNIYISETIRNIQIKKMSKAKVNITYNNGILKSHILQSELSNKDLKKVLKAYQNNKKYIYLNGNVIIIEKEVEELYDYVNKHDIDIDSVKDEIIHPFYNIFKLEEKESSLEINIDDKIYDLVENITNYEKKEYDTKLTKILKPYQVIGLKWLRTLYDNNLGGILADDMGLGKTVQVLAMIDSIPENIKVLVICPKSLIYNWDNEIKKFGLDFNRIVYVGNKDERKELIKDIDDNKKTIILSSYDTIRNDFLDNKELIFDLVILDEAQNIKTIDAKRTLAVKNLNAKNKLVLTGTPIENSVMDLWSIFDFLMPGYLYNYNKFKKIESKLTNKDQKMYDFILYKIKPFILRRTKKEVLKELPDKEEKIMYGRLLGESKKIYDAYLLSVKEKLKNPKITKFDLLKDIIKLRQLSISPKLVYEKFNKESNKIDMIVDLINKSIITGHKVLVFSTFLEGFNLIKEHFNKDIYYQLDGTTKASDRIKMVNDFNLEISLKKVFFISLKAGGTGLNLTGADIVIHLDPWWNKASEEQANDRAHRIGQERKVTIYKVIMKDTIEEKIIEIQDMKKELFENIIDGNKDIKFSIDDYKYLLD